jgi:signal transduction histidine kinase
VAPPKGKEKIMTAQNQPPSSFAAESARPGAHPPCGCDHDQDALNRRLEAMTERLERTFRRERQFACDASHELCTPLAALRLELEEARLHPDDTDLASLLDRTLSNVGRLQTIVGDLLLLARPDTGTLAEPELIDLAELVRGELSRREDRHEVQLRLDPEVMARGVRTQLGRVLGNLLDNAQRYAKNSVRIRVRRRRDIAELTVCDDGEGVARAEHDRIFQPFTRLATCRSRSHGGTGLGLAIARDLAEANHGTLRVGPSPTQGACFVLQLPAVTDGSGRHLDSEPPR